MFVSIRDLANEYNNKNLCTLADSHQKVAERH